MKPQKSDFIAIVDLPEVIKDQEINAHVEDAYKFDIKPILGALATDMKAYNGTDRPQLQAFYESFVLEWWVRLAFYRFYEVHGQNITQFGITKTTDPENTFKQAEGIEKAIKLKRMKTDAYTLYTLMLNEVWKFDNVSYRKPSDCGSDSDGSSWGINAIG